MNDSHSLLLLALGRLYCAPLSLSTLEEATILDVGCGTGSWCLALSKVLDEDSLAKRDAPSAAARIYGIDLSLSQIPAHYLSGAKRLPNCTFETIDVMSSFAFNTGTFDFVNARLLMGGIKDWDTYLRNLCRVSKRGAWVECVEMDLELYECDSECLAVQSSQVAADQINGHGPQEALKGSERSGNTGESDTLERLEAICRASRKQDKELNRWTSKMITLFQESNLDPYAATHLLARVQNAAFKNVQSRILRIPVGEWSSDRHERALGALALEFFNASMLEWVQPHMEKELSLGTQGKHTNISESLAAVAKELHCGKYYWKFHVVCGQKSLN